ncbi:hypothetical protein IJ380_02240 [Candidatus Saccharibacteria bacterium]|nr:hypothetical protein [Candidatus Saccharibacteria bacterium]
MIILLEKLTNFLFGGPSTSSGDSPESSLSRLIAALDLIATWLPSPADKGIKTGTANFCSYEDKKVFIMKYKYPKSIDVFLQTNPRVHVFSTEGAPASGFAIYRHGEWENYIFHTLLPEARRAKHNAEESLRSDEAGCSKRERSAERTRTEPVDDASFFS